MIISVPLPLTSNTTKAYTNYVPLPPIVDCPDFPQSPFMNNLGDGWNCNLCAPESEYFIPYERGDLLYFQLALPDRKNPSPNTLIAGWQLSTNPPFVLAYIKAQIYDCSGTTVLFDDVDLFAFDFWVSFNSTIGSIQNFTIDTATFPIGFDSFRIKITTYDLSNNVDVVQWSEIYGLPKCDAKTVLIQSTWKNLDCTPHFHGAPSPFLAQSSPPPPNYVPLPYTSSLRIVGEIYKDKVSTSSTINENDRILSQQITETYKIEFLQPLPPFAVNMLRDALYGDNLTISSPDIGTLQVVNPSEINRGEESGRAFVPELTVETNCKNFNKTCN